MFFVKYVFYFTCEEDNNYISSVASPLMIYKYCPLHSYNKRHIQQKHLNILYLLVKAVATLVHKFQK